jgi:hypothetical protein
MHCQKRCADAGHTFVFIIIKEAKRITLRWPERVVHRLTVSFEMEIAFS